MKKSEKLQIVSSLFSNLVQGKTLDEASEEMGIDSYELEKIQKSLIEWKTEELQTKPVEHIYVEYMLTQFKNVADLTKIVDDYNGEHYDGKNTSAVVGAIRARSEITDKILQRGQDCGVIKKAPERRENVHGIFIAELSSSDLRKQIVDNYTRLARFTTGHKNVDITELPAPEKLHYGDAIDISGEDEDRDEIDVVTEYKKPKKKAKKSKKKKKETS